MLLTNAIVNHYLLQCITWLLQHATNTSTFTLLDMASNEHDLLPQITFTGCHSYLLLISVADIWLLLLRFAAGNTMQQQHLFAIMSLITPVFLDKLASSFQFVSLSTVAWHWTCRRFLFSAYPTFFFSNFFS